jgi:hypothetical protein
MFCAAVSLIIVDIHVDVAYFEQSYLVFNLSYAVYIQIMIGYIVFYLFY